MKSVIALIKAHGGLDRLRLVSLEVRVPGLQPLAVSYEGKGPRDLPLVSVRHWYTQNGDLMYDPEMTFEVPERGWDDPAMWGPVTYTQHGLGIHQVAVFKEHGRVLIAPSLVRSLRSFAKTWDRNIAEQGFVEALTSTAGATNGREDRAG